MAERAHRTQLFRRHRPAPGSSTDAMAVLEDRVEPRIRFFRYGPGGDVEEGEVDVEQAVALRPRGPDDVLWIDCQGLGDGDVVRRLGRAFRLHPLAQADIVNLGQRPKADEFRELQNLIVILRMLGLLENGRLDFDQTSIVKSKGVVLTFQERYGDCLDPLRARIRAKRTTLIEGGSDYLSVQVIDAVVDGYFPVLEAVGSRLEALEEALLAAPRPEHLEGVHRVRRDLMTFRRAVWPLRDAIHQLLRDEVAIGRGAQLYLRDVGDHLHQVVDTLETYREIAGGLVEIYLSMLGHRTNEVVRVLTVISSIFIPLTFLAGVYGMNFDPDVPGNMPELRQPYAYEVFWAASLALALVMLVVFRRLGWLGGAPSRRRRRAAKR